MACSVRLRNYDVFLNHRGPDVKKGLVSHVYAALKRINFTAFVDNMDIHPGEHAWEAITSAIENSKIHIAVFSPSYAESRWCLEELHLLLECFHKKRSTLFLPIFFNVAPFDLRLEPPSRPSRYRRQLEELASRHKAPDIEKWKKALHDASMISGFVFPDDFQGDEVLLVESIVGKVLDALSKQSLLSIPEHSVGLEEKLCHALAVMKGDKLEGHVWKLVIYGMGGVGKSTLAKFIYNRIHKEFESACFIQNVSELSKGTGKGFRGLQEDMLHQLLHRKDISVPDTERGRQMIRDRLTGNVLIILDDVSEKQQLDELMPPHDCCLGRSSQIVITTRDQEVVTLVQASACISMDGLSTHLARKLFNLHAFPMPEGDKPSSSFVEPQKELAVQLADACQGLPLALEVLGSHLRGKDICEWQATARVLVSGIKLIAPQKKVTSILKISYNALRSTDEKEMFLDIACFLKGEHKDKGMRIWGSLYSDASAELNLKNLINKCLIKLSENGELTMHDLFCAMGREIVDDNHADYWDRSHLWREDDARRVLQKRKGTSHVRALRSSVQKTWDTMSLAGMDELKLLVLSNVTLTGDLGKISKEIRWFQLWYFPLEEPLTLSEIGFDNIAVLDLEGSKFSSLDIYNCMLESLKELNLRNCSNLKRLHARLSHLERLILSGCVSLEEVPVCIGMGCLRYLDISSCRNLKELPDGITSLRALTCLLMNECGGITRLPYTIGQLTALESIGLDGVPLDTLPLSFGSLCSLKALRFHSSQLRELPWLYRLGNITSLEIISCPSISLSYLFAGITFLQKLTHLRVSRCASVCQLSEQIGRLRNLTTLYVNDIVELKALPSSIQNLSCLEILSLEGCSNLCEILSLPYQLKSLDVTGCTSLTCLNISRCNWLKILPDGIEKSLYIVSPDDWDGLKKPYNFEDTRRPGLIVMAQAHRVVDVMGSLQAAEEEEHGDDLRW